MSADEDENCEVDARVFGDQECPAASLDEPPPKGAPSPKSSAGVKLSRGNSILVVSLVIVLAMAGLAGWLGQRARQSNQAAQQRAIFLETARQEAVNLTSISYTELDADIKRIVDSTSGRFHDEFKQRSPAFIEVVKQAQAKSVGTVTAAGLESISEDQACVLVAVSVQTSNAGAQEQQPRAWRMRISVTKDHNDAKVSDVQFVP